MMKRILIFSIIICTILIAQVSLSSIQILAWDTSNGKWSWYTLGTGFTKVGNVISVTPAAPATGISIVFTILYPSAIGLGGWENPLANEIAYIYGP